MSFLSQLNPFDLDDGHLWDYVPLAAGARDIAQGKGLSWETALDLTPAAPFVSGAQDLYRGAKYVGGKIRDGFGGVADAVNDAYAKKAEGYDAIRAETERLKGVRQGQKDFAYNLADSKYQPTRDAIAAVYGDPRSWKL